MKMGYWKSKVLPTMKKLFERSPTKKAVVVESSKAFDVSKEAINKEIEEKKTELGPKVVEIYEATSAEVKALVREPKEDGLKKHSAEVQTFLEALVKIEFPGSKAASEVLSTSVGPVTFIFEKVCEFLPAEEKSREVEIVEEVVKTDEPAKEKEETKPEEITSAEKEIEIVEEKKEEVKPAPVPVSAAAEEKKPVVEEEKKATVEEKKPAVEEDKKAAVEEKKPAAEEKKPAVEEKKPVEEVKKEVVAAVPVAEASSTKAVETPVVVTPSKAPETPAASLPKA